ncbi:MAG TPA: DUF4097 family beta strand repeat-containing protein [Nocardioides sp.]|nr:DUF4097 family beta strand repeat-containing protein [Nocardioides sp.]
MSTTHPVERGFDTPRPIDLYVENGSGSVRIAAADTQRTTVHVAGKDAEQVVITQDGDSVTVVAPKVRGFFGLDHKLDMEVSVPSHSRVVVKTGSADIDVTGVVGSSKVKSGSGQVDLDVVGDVAVVDTGSGDIHINEARAEVRIRSGSGDVTIDAAAATTAVSTGSGDVEVSRVAGPLAVKTGSGDLEVGEASGDVTMTTGSGSTVIRTAHRGRITSKGASGDVRIGIPAGTPVWTDIKTVTGQLTSSIEGVGEPEPGADSVELRATTVSGDVVLVPA